MSGAKRNQFLDAPSDSEDPDLENGYDSEAREEGRGRATKRRKVDRPVSHTDHDESENDTASIDGRDDPNEAPDGEAAANSTDAGDGEEEDVHATFTGQARTLQPTTVNAKPSKDPPLRTLKNPTTRDPHLPPPGSKPGIVYLSRIPPFLKPSSLRSLLTPHAPRHGLGRIFLTPEDPETTKARKRAGGNKKKSFVDGWVEFVSKREAKIAADALNARSIGGRGWYAEDLWSMRYLRGFKWADLVESLGAESRERQSRMRAEISQNTKENKEFLRAVETAKMQKTRQEKRKRKMDKDGENGDERFANIPEPKMQFKQHKLQDKETRHKSANKVKQKERPQQSNGVLDMIFG